MANRCKLHFKHLAPLKAWLDSQGIEHRPGVPPYQVLRIRAGAEWRAIYVRNSATQHYTIPSNLESLVQRFLNSRHRGGED